MVNLKMTNIKAQLKDWAIIIGILIAAAIFGAIQGLIIRWLGYEGMMP